MGARAPRSASVVQFTGCARIRHSPTIPTPQPATPGKENSRFLIERHPLQRNMEMEALSANVSRTAFGPTTEKSGADGGKTNGSAELWRPIDEAAQQLGMKPKAITQRLIPMSYYPEPMRGRIRFRVMGTPRRTELWFPDLAAMDARRAHPARVESRNAAGGHRSAHK
jgi:hypothetical protein